MSAIQFLLHRLKWQNRLQMLIYLAIANTVSIIVISLI